MIAPTISPHSVAAGKPQGWRERRLDHLKVGAELVSATESYVPSAAYATLASHFKVAS
jgi:hypothetical protein